MTGPETKTGGRLLVECLLTQGCERLFTVPGESFLGVLDALYDTPEIQTVVCRHEGGAAYMACADGSLTGRPDSPQARNFHGEASVLPTLSNCVG